MASKDLKLNGLKEILDNSLLLVESPSKIKIFEKYIHKISKNCVVLSSRGHIFNLLGKKEAIDVDKDFHMTWEPTLQSKKSLPEILAAAKEAKQIIIATDPDREGEAIGWHILNYLKQKKIVKTTHRILFHALTQDDIYNALADKGEVRQDLVDAYFARLSLDFLVGFNISPLLWRKLPTCLSAGRVQSAALKNIVELEYKIVKFKPQPYFNLHGLFDVSASVDVNAVKSVKQSKKGKAAGGLDTKLVGFPYATIDGFCIYHTEKQIKSIVKICDSVKKYKVSSVKTASRSKHSPAPFITSTMQQEASSKLKLSPKQTMQIAQKLYEGVKIGSDLVGLITYMRTDNVNMSSTAAEACREYIRKHFPAHLPGSIRHYKNNAKNTQEAHECIRPTDFNITPASIKNSVDKEIYYLYDLIWRRSVASQMKDAIYQDQTVDISASINDVIIVGDSVTEKDSHDIDKVKNELASLLKTNTLAKNANDGEELMTEYRSDTDDDALADDLNTIKSVSDDVLHGNNDLITFQTKHTVLTYSGWLELYTHSDTADAEKVMNSDVVEGQGVVLTELSAESKQTQPPSRYTAASLITRMDKLGIGRPGTYTNILDILATREYITKTDGYLKPTQKSWFLIAFLEQYFNEYLKYEFTASMENTLDQIAQGSVEWLSTMKKFWAHFSQEVAHATKATYDDMKPYLEKIWHEYFFKDTNVCKKCGAKATVRFWKGNGFLSCSKYPECNWTSPIESMKSNVLGVDPNTGQQISMITDQYNNTYLQWSYSENNSNNSVKSGMSDNDSSSVKGGGSNGEKNVDVAQVQVKIPTILKAQFTSENFSLEKALKLKQLPLNLGVHPETGLSITLAIGKFGPYIKYNDQFISVKSNPLAFTLDDAINLISRNVNKVKSNTSDESGDVEVVKKKAYTRRTIGAKSTTGKSWIGKSNAKDSAKK